MYGHLGNAVQLCIHEEMGNGMLVATAVYNNMDLTESFMKQFLYLLNMRNSDSIPLCSILIFFI